MPTHLKIRVADGVGTGSTNLAAFDAALFDAGIGNFNLIYLSSIIPMSCSVSIGKYKPTSMEMGQRLYVVMSRAIGEHDESVYAGLGWVYTDNGGIFVEHRGTSYDQVKEEIELSIVSMIRYRPFLKSREKHYKIVGVDKALDPTCALVAAIYTSEAW